MTAASIPRPTAAWTTVLGSIPGITTFSVPIGAEKPAPFCCKSRIHPLATDKWIPVDVMVEITGEIAPGHHGLCKSGFSSGLSGPW